MTIWSYFRGPEVFDIKVGYRCNNACLHCIVGPVRRRIIREDSRQDLETEQIEELINEAVASGAKRVVLTGGEITIRSDFEKLLQFAVALKLRVVIQTNGRMLSQKKLCDRLISIRDIVFIVALHGSNPQTHDRITQRINSFHETCTAIRNLKTINKAVTVKLVLLKQNRGEALATAQLARELGATQMCIVFPHAAEFSKNQFYRVVSRYREFQDDIRAVCFYAEKEEFSVSFENIPYCTVPGLPGFWGRSCDLRSAISSRQEASTDKYGRFDWEHLRQTMKKKRGSCRTCVFDHLCEGPWREYVQAYGFDEFVPIGVDTDALKVFSEVENL